jgi:hypothetical protein
MFHKMKWITFLKMVRTFQETYVRRRRGRGPLLLSRRRVNEARTRDRPAILLHTTNKYAQYVVVH